MDERHETDGPHESGSREATKAVAEPQPRRRVVRIVVSAVLGSGLLALLVASLDDPRAAFRGLTSLDPTLLLLGLAAYVACYVCRAVRFRMLLPGGRAPLVPTTAIVAVHNLLNMLLPMRSGELSWVLLAQRKLGARLAAGAASLLLARVYDVVGIAAFFLAAVAGTGGFGSHGASGGDERTKDLVLAAAALLALSIAGLLLVSPLCRFALRAAERMRSRTRAVHAARRILSALAEQLDGARRRGAFWPLFLVTELQWLFTFATCFAILRAHPDGEGFPFLASIVGSTGLSIALILPINPVGNVGTFQAGWIAGYLLAGLDREAATATSIAAHACILGYAAILALAAQPLLRGGAPRVPAGSESE